MDPQIQIICQLLLAAILGGAVGLEREYMKREAGFRTYSLTCLGASLFTIISFELFEKINRAPGVSFDPSRIVQAIAVGVGFLGAGLIIYRRSHIEGLTTAAGLWAVAAIGVAVGVQLYLVAVFATFLAVGVLSGLRLVEERFLDKKYSKEEKSP